MAKIQPSDKCRPVFSPKIRNSKLIAHLRKNFFRPARAILRDNLPWLRLAHQRFSQPGQRVPVKGRPTLTQFCSQELGISIRTLQRWLAPAPSAPPAVVRNCRVDELQHNKWYAGRKTDGKHYWLTPPKIWKDLKKRYPGIWDCCPCPRPKGYDALKVPWRKITWCNMPFSTTVDENGKKVGLTAWVRKAIAEQAKGNTTVIPMPMDYCFHLLLTAGATFRSIGQVKWLATEDGSEQPSGRMIVEIVLRGAKRGKNQRRKR